MELTKEQQDFLNTEGRIVLCAVPGSGKTFIVAKKLISYLKEWKYLHRGVAALSFTNVASDEIKRQITDSSQKTSEMGYPHFVGTLDSFINNLGSSHFCPKTLDVINRCVHSIQNGSIGHLQDFKRTAKALNVM